MRIALPTPRADSPSLERAARVALLASVALLPLPGLLPPPWPGTDLRWSDLPLAVAVAAFGLARAGRFRPRPWQWAALAYAGWVAASWIFHGGTRAGGLKALGVASLAATALVASELDVGRPLARVAGLGAVASAALAVAGLVARALGLDTPLVGWTGDFTAGEWARAQAGFTHPNLAASYALFAWGAAGAEARPGLRRAWQWGAAALAVTAFSRAVLPLLALPWLAAGGRRGRAAALAVAFALALLTLVRVDVDPSRPAGARIDSAPSTRAEELVTAFDSLRAQPWFGVGPGQRPARLHGLPYDAHCTPLSVAATYGLPALVLFALACGGAWGSGAPRPAAAAVGALLLDGLATDVEDFRHFWLALGLAAARPAGVDGGSRRE